MTLFSLKERPNPRVIVIPVPWEGTVSYQTGTSLGPQALIEASPQIDLLDVEFGSLKSLGIHCQAIHPQLLEWNKQALAIKTSSQENRIQKINTLSEKINKWILNQCQKYSSQDVLIVLLGGEHSIALSGFQTVAQKTNNDYGVLQIDAHKDLRKAYQGYVYSHASVFYNLLTSHFAPQKLVQVGIRDFCEEEKIFAQQLKGQIMIFYDRYLKCALHEGKTWQSLCQKIVDALPYNVYISLDIDGLSPWLCPDTGTPVPGGLDFDQLITLLKQVASCKKIIGMDLVEIGASVNDRQWNGNVAMRILYKMLGFAAVSQKWIQLNEFKV